MRSQYCGSILIELKTQSSNGLGHTKGVETYRCRAIDANDMSQRLLPVANPFNAGTQLPGLYRRGKRPNRTSTGQN